MTHGEKVLMGLLAVGCVIAASILFMRWLNPPSLEPSPTIGQAGLKEFEVRPTRPFQVEPMDSYSEITERPLFLAERRPPEEQPQDTLASDTPAETDDLLLLGVVLTPETTMALVQVDKAGKIERLKVGAEVNGWQLQSVQADRVVLQSGERKLDLPLLRNRKKAASTSERRRSRRDRQRNYGAAAQPSPSASPVPPYE